MKRRPVRAKRRTAEKKATSPPPCVGCRGLRTNRLDSIAVPDGPASTEATVLAMLPGIQAVSVDDQLVVLDPRSATSVLLNASAGLIFLSFDAPRSLGSVIEQLVTETGMASETIAPDVIVTADRLRAGGLLVDPQHAIATALPTSDEPVRHEDESKSPDRARWAYDSGPRSVAGVGVSVRLEGVPVGFDADELLETFLPISEPAGPDAASCSVTVSAEIAVEHVASILYDRLDQTVVDACGGLRFHAGAVERDGRVTVILGQSGQGKSTLTAALVQHGFAYLTDEVVVTDGVDVRSYPRPLDLDEPARTALGLGPPDVETGRRKAKVYPERLGAVSSGGRLAMLIVLDQDDTADQAAAPLSASTALMALLPLTFGATFDDAHALESLAAICEAIPVIRLQRGPLAEMVATIEEHLVGRIDERGG